MKRTNKKRANEIKILLNNKVPVQEIAKTLGCSPVVVYYHKNDKKKLLNNKNVFNNKLHIINKKYKINPALTESQLKVLLNTYCPFCGEPIDFTCNDYNITKSGKVFLAYKKKYQVLIKIGKEQHLINCIKLLELEGYTVTNSEITF